MKPSVFSAAMALIVAGCLSASAGSLLYEFTGGSTAPTLLDPPAGVTASAFSIGTGLGSMSDNGGGPDSLRLSGNDGIGSSTATVLGNNAYFSFSITIAEGTTVSLESIGLDYKATSASSYLNARIFSSVRGHASAGGDTIGILGRQTGGTDAAFVVNDLNLVTPRSNSGVGANIVNGDFTNLVGPKTVTFYLPFITGSTSSGSYIDLDNVRVKFVTPVPPVVEIPPISVTDFQVMPDRSARISFSGTEGKPYSVMTSEDLVFPVYRKRWTSLENGSFGSAGKVVTDPGASAFPRRFYSVASSSEPKAKIMPVGDSITEGASNFLAYKGPLYDKLRQAGYRFEYTGPKTSTYNSPVYGNVSLAHEAYSGSNPTMVRNQFVSHFANYPADIVIIHAGHNMNVGELVLDAAGEAGIVATVESATRDMISTARSVNPKVRILLSKVIPSGKLPKYSYIPALNVRLGEVAAELNTQAQPVIIVDQAEGFFWETDTIPSDKVHPSNSGGEKMAVKYFNALVPLLE